MSVSQKYLPVTLVFLLFVSVSFAQTQNSSLSIIVKNQLGEIVSDAEIVLISQNQNIKTLKSNKQGVVQFSKLEVGDYQINVTAKGFNNYKSDLFSLKTNEIKKLEVELEIKLGETNVSIGGNEDVESDSTARVLDEPQIQKLPDDPQKLEQILRSLAGESVTGEKMPITVDGMQSDKLPPKDQIQAIRINQNVFSAQFDNPNGWGIEIYTRSTADKISGSLSFDFSDSRFNASDPFIGQRIPTQSKNFYFNLSGPVTKKSMFSISIYPQLSRSSNAVNATILDSNLNPVSLKTTIPTTNRGLGSNSSFSIDVNQKNKIAVSYNNWIGSGNGNGAGGFSLASRISNNKYGWHNFRLSESYFINENLINQFRLSITYNTNKSFGGSNDSSINVLDAFFGGGAQNDNENKRFSLETTNDTSWQNKKYSLNFGWRLRGSKIDQLSTANFGGTYTFSGRTAPVLDANNNPVPGQFIQISSLESYRRTLFFQRLNLSPTQIRALGGGANQFTISGGNPQINVNQWDAAGYVQNSYKLRENLALSFGLRYENQTNIESNLDFSPRFGIIWSPKLKQTDPKKKENLWLALPKISLGLGAFYSRYDVNNFLSIKQANDADKQNFLITDSNILDLFPNVATISQLQQFALPKNRRFINEELQTPQMRFISISASKRLPLGFSSNFSFAYSNSARQSVTRNINALFSGVRPLGNIGNVYETNSIAKSNRKSFTASLNLPQDKIYGNIRYTFTKSSDNRVSGNGLPTNPFDFSQEFSPSSNDGVHSISSYFSYELPFSLSLSGDFNFQTGSRFNIFTGKDTNGDGYFNERPAFASNLNKPNLISTKYGILDPNPAPTDKIIPRNFGRGNSTVSFDMSLSKSFGFNGDKANKKPPKQTLTITINANNIFNIVNRANPIGNMSSPNFLQVLSVSGGNFTEAAEGFFYFGGNTAPRALSFGMSFRF